MKKSFLFIFILLFAFAANAQQSAKDTVRNNYTQEFLLSPLSFFVGGFEIGYGIVRPKTNTRLLAGYYFSENAVSYGESYNNMEGFRLELQHLFLKPVDGGMRYYAGGYGIYKSISMDKRQFGGNNPRTVAVSGSAVSFGIILGVRSFVADNFFFDLYAGGGPTISLNDNNVDDVHIDIVNPYKRGINPRLGLTFGIAF